MCVLNIEPSFLPVDIRHNQCPCRLLYHIIPGGTIVNRTYGTYKNLCIYLFFTNINNNVWSYLLWFPVILLIVKRDTSCGYKTTAQRRYIHRIAAVVSGVYIDNAMPCHHTGYDRHGTNILWKRQRKKKKKTTQTKEKQIERETIKLLYQVCKEKSCRAPHRRT